MRIEIKVLAFAHQGVDNSKMILETILGKIKLYEKGQDKKWAELIQVRIYSVFNSIEKILTIIIFHRILATSIQTSVEVRNL